MQNGICHEMRMQGWLALPNQLAAASATLPSQERCKVRSAIVTSRFTIGEVNLSAPVDFSSSILLRSFTVLMRRRL